MKQDNNVLEFDFEKFDALYGAKPQKRMPKGGLAFASGCAIGLAALAGFYCLFGASRKPSPSAAQPDAEQVNVKETIENRLTEVNKNDLIGYDTASHSEAAKPVNNQYKWLTIEGMPEYNSNIRYIISASEKTGILPMVLAVIMLTETGGKGSMTYEPNFRKYVDDDFIKDPNGKLPENRYTGLLALLQKQDASLTLEQFKRQLSTAAGPMQIVYATAVENGFIGTLEELCAPDKNVEFAAKNLKRGLNGNYALERALRYYNSGRANGTPTSGYLERASGFEKILLENKKLELTAAKTY